MNELKKIWEAHCKLGFPKDTSCDARLSDCITELAAVDAYYAGFITSSIGGVKSIKFDKTHIDALKNSLPEVNTLNEIDKELLNQCIVYLDSIDEIISICNREKK